MIDSRKSSVSAKNPQVLPCGTTGIMNVVLQPPALAVTKGPVEKKQKREVIRLIQQRVSLNAETMDDGKVSEFVRKLREENLHSEIGSTAKMLWDGVSEQIKEHLLATARFGRFSHTIRDVQNMEYKQKGLWEYNRHWLTFYYFFVYMWTELKMDMEVEIIFEEKRGRINSSNAVISWYPRSVRSLLEKQ